MGRVRQLECLQGLSFGGCYLSSLFVRSDVVVVFHFIRRFWDRSDLPSRAWVYIRTFVAVFVLCFGRSGLPRDLFPFGTPD